MGEKKLSLFMNTAGLWRKQRFFLKFYGMESVYEGMV